MSRFSISAVLSRATLNARNAKHGKQIPDVRPGSIQALKLKLGQTTVKTRRMRSQLNRLNDRILSHTNAIIKTREQQTEVSACAFTHKNTIAQLRHSISIAENAFAVLRSDILKAVNDDKTFIIKETEEEVKLLYAENIRLIRCAKEADREGQFYFGLLQDAAHKATPKTREILLQQITDLSEENADLRDKAVAYRSKKKRLDIEAGIIEHMQRKVPVQKTVEEAAERRKELEERIARETRKAAVGKREFRRKVHDLTAIIEEQRFAIARHLAPPGVDSDEDDFSEADEEDDQES
jgi:hypothetical protein